MAYTYHPLLQKSLYRIQELPMDTTGQALSESWNTRHQVQSRNHVSIHFSLEPTKLIENILFSIFKKKVRLLILTFRVSKIRAFLQDWPQNIHFMTEFFHFIKGLNHVKRLHHSSHQILNNAIANFFNLVEIKHTAF